MTDRNLTLFDPVTIPESRGPALVYTNRFNLLEILSRRLIPPRSGFEDELYFSDLAELCPGRVPIVAGPVFADAPRPVPADDKSAFPVALELDGARLDASPTASLSMTGITGATLIGAPDAVAWAPAGCIPLTSATAVHFRSQAELDEHRLRRYENIRDDLPVLVSPQHFGQRGDREIAPWLASLTPEPDPGLRVADRISGGLILLGAELQADEEALRLFAEIANGRVTGKRGRTRAVAPWLFVLAAGQRRGAGLNERVFAAAVSTFLDLDYPRTWHPVEHAEAVRKVVSRARLTAADKDELDRHFDVIVAVLRNDRDFQPFHEGRGLAAAKAFLLVLMRPDPDDQLAWSRAETGADADVRMTAAALTGVLHGRKRLSVSRRPPELDDFLAEQESTASSQESVTGAPEPLRVRRKDRLVSISTARTKRRLLERTLVAAPSGLESSGEASIGSTPGRPTAPDDSETAQKSDLDG